MVDENVDDSAVNGAAAGVVLVGVESTNSDPVLLEAARLARDLGAALVCAHVDADRYTVEEHPNGTVTSLPLDPDLPELDDEPLDSEMASHVERVLSQTGVSWSFRSLAGDPARALSHLAEGVDARFIVIGTHDARRGAGIREFFRSSVATHLAHHQHRPVVVVPLSPVIDGGALPWE